MVENIHKKAKRLQPEIKLFVSCIQQRGPHSDVQLFFCKIPTQRCDLGVWCIILHAPYVLTVSLRSSIDKTSFKQLINKQQDKSLFLKFQASCSLWFACLLFVVSICDTSLLQIKVHKSTVHAWMLLIFHLLSLQTFTAQLVAFFVLSGIACCAYTI